MKGRVVSGVLAVIGILALSATAAQAGGGLGAASFNTFFACQAIDGGNVGQVVSIHDVLTNDLIREGVRIGNGVLLCQQVDVKNSTGAFINGGISSDLVKCYSISVKGPKAASETVVLRDDVKAAGETVNVSDAFQFLCGPTSATAP